eukprot:3813600-Heterocapsa_arctica.AAC.1
MPRVQHQLSASLSKLRSAGLVSVEVDQVSQGQIQARRDGSRLREHRSAKASAEPQLEDGGLRCLRHSAAESGPCTGGG